MKGHDSAAVIISEKQNDPLQVTADSSSVIIDHDEIKMYVESRYISPIEACWRILSLPLYNKSHTIIRLPVHLPNQQTVMIHSSPEDTTLENVINQTTMLLDYFALNARDKNAQQYAYVQIPKYYTFKTKEENNTKIRCWEKRKGSFNCIGRIYSVSPSSVELFHLRLLLLNIKGATSFENLKTVNGVIYDTFVETCLALHLIEDDEEWKRAMEEASFWMMPRQLRRLFVRILIYCNPLHPLELWNTFKLNLSDDFKRNNNRMTSEQAQKKAFSWICKMLRTENHQISDFIDTEELIEDEAEEEINPQILTSHLETGEIQYKSLNVQQKIVVDSIINRLIYNENNDQLSTNCYFINGPGGSGKTFIYQTLYNLLIANKKKVCSMAFTGIAATLLPNGKTIHKTFALPVSLFSDSVSNIKNQTKEADYLRKIDLFIFDEAPVAPRYALEVIDRTLRDIIQKDEPFGGKIFLLGGDFRQLLPVQRYCTRTEIINLSIKNSLLWNNFKTFDLKNNMRTLPTEVEFSKFLINLGNGSLNDGDNNISLSYFPNHCVAAKDEDIIEGTYADMLRAKKYREAINFAILSSRNDDVDEINKKVIKLLDETTEKIYIGIDSVQNCDNGALNESLLPEYLNTLNPLSLPPYELILRQHCIVMLIRNLCLNEGLCNGTRLLILDINVLRCEILTGDKAGDIIFLNRVTLYSENDYPFTFKRRQFPIKLAFAMTINKSQGQTFERIGLDLRKDVFSHGQLYVALSRVRSWNAFKIYLDNQFDKGSIKNFVFKELFH